MTNSPETVVIVTTRDRADSLDRCLGSLRADSSRVKREILVVDNGSTDHTAEVVRAHAAASSVPVRRLWEAFPGQSRARNLGIDHSAAPYVLFTDDDVTVHDGWADALTAALSQSGVAAAGGRVLPRWSGGPVPAWLDGPQLTNVALEDYGETSFRCYGPYGFPVGANLGFRREALAPFRPAFDERLGHRGRIAMGTEEWHLLRRMVKTGAVQYEARAVVDHHVSADRLRYNTVRRRMLQSGFGQARSARLLDERQPAWPRVAVRSARVGLEARRQRRLHAGGPPRSGSAAWEDFYAHFWLGFHLEMLTGRCRPMADFLAGRLLDTK